MCVTWTNTCKGETVSLIRQCAQTEICVKIIKTEMWRRQSMKIDPAKRNGLKCIKSILCAYPQKWMLAVRFEYRCRRTSACVCMSGHNGLFTYVSAGLFIEDREICRRTTNFLEETFERHKQASSAALISRENVWACVQHEENLLHFQLLLAP